MKKFLLFLPALLLCSSAVAQDTTASSANPALSTNIIGTQEAPAVLNVVPWKDKEVVLEKKDPSTRLLDQVLEPVDQEVLLREVEYFRSMSKTQQGQP